MNNAAAASTMNILHLFSLDWYEQQTGNKWQQKTAALCHYLEEGWSQGFDPHPLFSGTFYLEQNPDVKNAGMPPLLHFVEHGYREGRDPHPMFATAWYSQQYPESISVNANSLVHYLTKGCKEGKRPNPDFDTTWYANNYMKLNVEETGALEHFITKGAAAGLARNALEEAMLTENGHSKSQLLQLHPLLQPDARPIKPASFPVTTKDVKSAALLSFDIWDTVLRRDCYPDEIKLQSARFLLLTRYWEIRPAYRNIKALLKRRIHVENASAPKRDFEFKFELAAQAWITDVLEPGIPKAQLLSTTNAIIAHEFAAESRSIRVDPEFRKFIEKGGTPPTVFTSDFYMGSDFIMKLLASQELDGYFVRGYSSSDTYRNKRSGELFAHLLHEFSVSPAEVVHIGDNAHADVEVPQRMGLRTGHYVQPAELAVRSVQKHAYETHLQGDHSAHYADLQAKLAAVQRTWAGEKKFDLERAGVGLAPIAASFILNVLEVALRFNSKSIYFFTREGQFLKDLYEEIVKDDPYNIGQYPTPVLLEVSRVATFAASLESLEGPELMRIWNQYSQQSLKAFCSSLNLDSAFMHKAARRHGIDLDEAVDMPWDDQRFMGVLRDADVEKVLVKHINTSKALLHRYLEEQGFYSNNAAVVVDIGWRGTIHDNLCNFTKQHVHGCYLGLFKFLNTQPKNSSKDGWLINYNLHEFCWERDEVAPLEMIFNGMGGSVIGYDATNQGVVAKRLVIPGEEAIVEKYVQRLQAGMMAGTKAVCDYVRLHGLISTDLRSLAKQTARELLSNPPQAIAEAYYKLEHNEMFGTGSAAKTKPVESISGACQGLRSHRLHAAAKSIYQRSNWKAGFLALNEVRTFYEKLSQEDRNTLPIEFRSLSRNNPTPIHGNSLKIGVYAPAPIIGSGGHRTIFNIARRLQRLGAELFIFLESEGAGVGAVEEYLQGTPAHINIGWTKSLPMDLVIATIAHSPAYLADYQYGAKAYLIQDFEAGFNPLSDAYIVAENSYCQGLSAFTIGNWLTHVLGTQYSVNAVPGGLGVDTDLYRPLPNVARENAICFLYQPDKPRRTPQLGIAALRLVKAARPDVKIYVYGSDLPIYLDFEVENLGLIRDLEAINVLYNRCKLGLCVSISNPSRIPYEMMAAGTVPVDVYRYNNLLDHENGTAVLSYQSETSLAEAMLGLLNNPKKLASRAAACIASAQTRTLTWEQDVIANNMFDLIARQGAEGQRARLQYTDEPVIAARDQNAGALAFCEWQRRTAQSPYAGEE
jgi:predicted HAD superfamily hydrolase/glycosyltransferase involved in cell wall biosynthesis